MKHKWCLSESDPVGAPVTSPSWGGLGRAANVNTDGIHCRINQALLSEMPSAVLAITKLKTIIKKGFSEKKKNKNWRNRNTQH